MGLGAFAGNLMRSAGFGETVIRLGVTGLSRAGKTVFITSLVANLLERGRMSGLRAVVISPLRSGPPGCVDLWAARAHRLSAPGAWPTGLQRPPLRRAA